MRQTLLASILALTALLGQTSAQITTDRTRELTSTTGTGTLTLAGTVSGFQTFVAGVGNGNTCYYCIEGQGDWEIGVGTVTDGAPDTLSRTIVLASSNAGSVVNLAAGVHWVYTVTPSLDKLQTLASPTTSTDFLVVHDADGGIKKVLIDNLGIGGAGADKKVGVDATATADYLGALASDGALRTQSPLTYADGGNFVTLGVNAAQIDHDSLQNFSAAEHFTQANIVQTGIITSGTWQGTAIDMQRGGLGADVSLLNGLLYIQSGLIGTTSNNSLQWNAAFAWGNHASQNYLDDDTADDVDDADIDWGAAAGQVNSDDVPEGSTNKYVTAANVGAVSANLDDTDASIEWEDANDLDAAGDVADDSHNHVIANIDAMTKAQLEGRISDAADLAEADGDTYSGTHDMGGATLEIPNAADVSANTGEGLLSWDSDDDKLYVGDGAAVQEIGGGGGTDAKVGVDSGATPDYLGAASNDGALRTDATLSYADGGNHVTLAMHANSFPQRATCWMDEATVVTGGSLTYSATTTQIHNAVVYQSPGANADSVSHSLFLKAGTYTVYFLGYSHNSRGKLDWTLDGGSITTGQDWYSASGSANVLKTVAGFTVSTDGYHKLVLTVNGKHASSTGYTWGLTKVWFAPASDPSRS